MLVSQFMTTRLVTVEPDDTLQTIREIFVHTGFHHLLVVERGVLTGVLSDRDLLRHSSPWLGTATEHPRDTATLHKRAHQIMSRHPETLHPDATLAEAVEKFRLKDVTCLPVTDAGQRPVGIVTWRDMLKLMGEIIAGIS
jgi:acetoin utilization protein AcuB